jgi:two-component system, response regulator YesN
MPYRVFFVEDEAITREGIRDNVDWSASGFEFCGEAADGELALPMLSMSMPDVLITDIKMPFMDGLQLSKIVRERMPWMKIVILSGHDEFQYAQQAIKLGVTDYLLKPITVQNLQAALQKLAMQLEQEKRERENLKRLEKQAEENLLTLREKLLFNLLVGALPPGKAVEEGQAVGLNLIARYYLVAILKLELGDRTEQYEYNEYQQLQSVIERIVTQDPDVMMLRRDWGDSVLLFKGNTPEFLEEGRDLILERIRQEVEKTRYKFMVGMGTTKSRITDVSQSYVEALICLQNPQNGSETSVNRALEQIHLPTMDKSAVENYLLSGVKEGFDEFFNAYLQPLGETGLKSNLIKNYIFVDVVLAVAKLVNSLDGEVEQIIPELNSIERIASNIETIEQLRKQMYNVISHALAYRDSRPKGQYKDLIRQAKGYIECHYTDPALSLHEVAARVNLSASHFSVVFSHETDQNFKEYLIEIRIKKAKELLRMTALRSADVAYQVGYNDPHYFSSVFKKYTGQSPIEFRLQS